MPLMWDNVTETKYNNFIRLWLLKIFFECLYFSEYDIRMLFFLFFGWEIGPALNTYTTEGMEGVHTKYVQLYTGGEELKNWS